MKSFAIIADAKTVDMCVSFSFSYFILLIINILVFYACLQSTFEKANDKHKTYTRTYSNNKCTQKKTLCDNNKRKAT